MSLGDVTDCVHLARNASIMHAADGLGALSDGHLNQRLVDVQIGVLYVHEHRHNTTQYEAVGRGGESVRWENDFVTRL